MSNIDYANNVKTPRRTHTNSRKHKVGKYENQTLPERNGRRNTKQKKVVTWIALAILLLLVVLLCRSCLNKDQLEGLWSIDEITSYHFNGKGRGELILPENSYAFSYKIQDNQLKVDFKSEAARDFQYAFTVEGNRLTLTGEQENQGVVYVLTKKK